VRNMLAKYHPSNGRRWHVVRTKPRKELLVAAQLRLRDVEVYNPTYHWKGNGKTHVYERAYFPGYLFVRAELDQVGSSALNWIPGLHGLVQFGGRPAIIAESLMISLRARLCAVEQASDQGLPRWKKGDPVRVTRGPFSGYSALFDERLPGRKRVRVLLALLRSGANGGNGRCLPLELDAGDIGKRHKTRRGRRRH